MCICYSKNVSCVCDFCLDWQHQASVEIKYKTNTQDLFTVVTFHSQKGTKSRRENQHRKGDETSLFVAVL